MAFQFQRQINFDASQLGQLNLNVGGLTLYFNQPRHNWNSNSITHSALLEKLFPNGDWAGPWAAGLLENINQSTYYALRWTSEASKDHLCVFDYSYPCTALASNLGFSWGSFFKPTGTTPP